MDTPTEVESVNCPSMTPLTTTTMFHPVQRLVIQLRALSGWAGPGGMFPESLGWGRSPGDSCCMQPRAASGLFPARPRPHWEPSSNPEAQIGGLGPCPVGRAGLHEAEELDVAAPQPWPHYQPQVPILPPTCPSLPALWSLLRVVPDQTQWHSPCTGSPVLGAQPCPPWPPDFPWCTLSHIQLPYDLGFLFRALP